MHQQLHAAQVFNNKKIGTFFMFYLFIISLVVADHFLLRQFALKKMHTHTSFASGYLVLVQMYVRYYIHTQSLNNIYYICNNHCNVHMLCIIFCPLMLLLVRSLSRRIVPRGSNEESGLS